MECTGKNLRRVEVFFLELIIKCSSSLSEYLNFFWWYNYIDKHYNPLLNWPPLIVSMERLVLLLMGCKLVTLYREINLLRSLIAHFFVGSFRRFDSL